MWLYACDSGFIIVYDLLQAIKIYDFSALKAGAVWSVFAAILMFYAVSWSPLR